MKILVILPIFLKQLVLSAQGFKKAACVVIKEFANGHIKGFLKAASVNNIS